MLIDYALIDNSYFTGDLRLSLSVNDEQTIQLNELVIAKQEKYIKSILGEVEYYKFSQNLNAGVPQTQIWIDFLDGKALTVQNSSGVDKTVYYKGFKQVLAGFIYFEYIRYFTSVQTNAGNVKQLTDNSMPADVSLKSISNYNSAIDFYGIDWVNKFANTYLNRYYYYDTFFCDTSINCYLRPYAEAINIDLERVKPTVYNYLYYTNLADDTAFADWQFTRLKKTNLFGI